MKLFEEREIFKAYRHSVEGGQALHLFSWPGASPGAPLCFKKSKQGGHLLDMDKYRLIETARGLGVRIIKIGREGTKKQHVDLCGRPLQKAIKQCKAKGDEEC